MPLVKMTRNLGAGYRRTLKSGTRYVFEPGEAQEVAAEDLQELLDRSPGMLLVVEPEFRGKRLRRYRALSDEQIDELLAKSKRLEQENAELRKAAAPPQKTAPHAVSPPAKPAAQKKAAKKKAAAKPE